MVAVYTPISQISSTELMTSINWESYRSAYTSAASGFWYTPLNPIVGKEDPSYLMLPELFKMTLSNSFVNLMKCFLIWSCNMVRNFLFKWIAIFWFFLSTDVVTLAIGFDSMVCSVDSPIYWNQTDIGLYSTIIPNKSNIHWISGWLIIRNETSKYIIQSKRSIM